MKKVKRRIAEVETKFIVEKLLSVIFRDGMQFHPDAMNFQKIYEKYQQKKSINIFERTCLNRIYFHAMQNNPELGDIL